MRDRYNIIQKFLIFTSLFPKNQTLGIKNFSEEVLGFLLNFEEITLSLANILIYTNKNHMDPLKYIQTI